MASLFTFDPDPPRVESPWLTPTDSPKRSTPQPNGRRGGSPAGPASGLLADYGVTRLEAEPQEGPTEYKLHLLLRPRRVYSSSSTGAVIAGSQQPQQLPRNQSLVGEAKTLFAPSHKARQNRLEHLTTQLLWRLQQSAPEHASSTGDLVLPKLPEAADSLQTPPKPGKLLAGLEDSRGALYEIGVSDDGTFVGLTKDELDESLNNLRAMAASLGCKVEIERIVEVGDCEWHESLGLTDSVGTKEQTETKASTASPSEQGLRNKARLYVAEALVTPDLSSKRHIRPVKLDVDSRYETPSPQSNRYDGFQNEDESSMHAATEQLRVTFTGPTTSGKSSLLGTLSTATLDNGRGKSRLSLLKHRHEIASGVTSSVTQELIGYKSDLVVNYASGNVTSWTDIHASAENGRLAFVSDSAGHPRYRRTTVRGLIGWAPHWILLCIAADDGENAPSSIGGTSSAQDILGMAGAGIDLATAHLDLCLKLDKPLAIVITKLDLASKTSLRKTLSKILTAVKATGRTPSILTPDQSRTVLESEFSTIPKEDNDTVRNIVDKVIEADSLNSLVPIVLTSAVKGTGIRLLHGLLRNLPIPATPTSHDLTGPALNPEQPACIFHIEDVFDLPASRQPLAADIKGSGIVVAGYMRFGRLSVGDTIVVGPFPAEIEESDLPSDKSGAPSSPSSLRELLRQPSTTELAGFASRNAASASVTKGEWHNAHLVSIRNLRLPVKTLLAGQVGTLGIVLDIPDHKLSNELAVPRIRKGMVAAIPSKHMIDTKHTLQAASGFTALFEDGDINSVPLGSLVVVYVASVRATARVVRMVPHAQAFDVFSNEFEDSDDVFGLDDSYEKEQESEPPIFGSDGVTDVALELLTNREWIELGSQILVMPGGGLGLYSGEERGEKGVAGLEGFVGKVIEVVD